MAAGLLFERALPNSVFHASHSLVVQDNQERANMLAEIGWACSMTGDRASAMQ